MLVFVFDIQVPRVLFSGVDPQLGGIGFLDSQLVVWVGGVGDLEVPVALLGVFLWLGNELQVGDDGRKLHGDFGPGDFDIVRQRVQGDTQSICGGLQQGGSTVEL